MMRQLSIRSTGTMGYREIPLYTSKRLTSEPPDRGEVYRHTFNQTNRLTLFSLQPHFDVETKQ